MVILIGSFFLWGLIHSLLASGAIKAFLQSRTGSAWMRGYRLGYNLVSVLTLLPCLWLVLILPDRTLYSIRPPWNLLMIAGQAVALLLLAIGFLQTDPLTFLGLRQLFEPDQGPVPLVVNGLYRMVRHPLYSAGLLILWLTPHMSINVLTVDLCATVYILIGAYFEERKLLREYGSAYAEYRSRTAMLVPGLTIKRDP